jgi:predicted dehydrogenase
MASPRVALWGAGVMAGAHAASCRALGWRIAAVASRTPAHASKLAADVGAVAVSSHEELLAIDGIDLAIVATPPADHATATEAWATRGVPTVVSTPLCDTLVDADRLVDLERRTQVPLLFASNLATAPTVQALFARVGRLGSVTTISGRSVGEPPAWGEFTSGAWGGGVLLHHAANQLALHILLARLAGLGELVAVSARLGRNQPGTSDDEADVDLTFSNGVHTHAAVSWRGHGSQVWDLQIAGEHGVLRLDMDPTPTLEHNGEPVSLPAPRSTPATVGLAHAGLIAQLTAFWHDVESGRQPVMNMQFGRDVLELVAAGYWSAGRDGAPVSLPFTGPRELTPLQLWAAAAH